MVIRRRRRRSRFGAPSDPSRRSGAPFSDPFPSVRVLTGSFRAPLREAPPPNIYFERRWCHQRLHASVIPIVSAGGDSLEAPRAPGRLTVREGSTGPRKNPKRSVGVWRGTRLSSGFFKRTNPSIPSSLFCKDPVRKPSDSRKRSSAILVFETLLTPSTTSPRGVSIFSLQPAYKPHQAHGGKDSA